MPGKEFSPTVVMLNDGNNYDRHLRERGLEPHDGGRARGIRDALGNLKVIIDRSYYLSGGITEDQLSALVVHEQIEQESDGPDAHFLATVGEFKHILNQNGAEGLRKYHLNLCNLMGGDNSVRNQALEKVLGK